MIPILIAIPFWSGDMTPAIEICKIISGLQKEHAATKAQVLLVHRQDCKLDPNMVAIVSRKFNTLTFHSMSPQKGWPAGPNGMFGSTMIYLANSHKDRWECVYWMEPDAVPICPDWYSALVEEWRRRHPKALIVGCRSDCHGDGTGDHITGCALYHPRIAKLMPYLTSCSQVAWDYQHRAAIVQVAGHTKLIENWYKHTKADPGILDRVNVGVKIIHGFKDNSLTNLVKKKYGIP